MSHIISVSSTNSSDKVGHVSNKSSSMFVKSLEDQLVNKHLLEQERDESTGLEFQALIDEEGRECICDNTKSRCLDSRHENSKSRNISKDEGVQQPWNTIRRYSAVECK